MLFDLRGKRKRVVQVVYAALAVLFAVSFVGFGIGSDAAGGIFDALGFGSGGSDTSNPQYEQQIEDAEARLAEDPKDEKALLDLASVRFLAGQAELDVDEATGAPVLTDEARTQLVEATAAWERYLATKPKQPDEGIAGQIVQAYVLLEDAEGAASAQEVIAESSPSTNTYGNLALYHYVAGEIPPGDAAAQKAVAEAPKTQQAQTEKQLDKLREQAQAQAKAAEEAAPQGEEAFGNPLQDLGGTPTTPAP
jgi:tetratricopeptide (TPR) repeat protein